MHKKWLLIILLVSSIGVHFAFFGHPNQVVFDEVHFGKFASAYSTHQYYFDIHPPLGKLIIAGFGKLFHFKPEFSFANIGQTFPDKTYLALRFLPTLAGSLLPLIIFLLALEFGFKPLSAFLAGMLVAFDNAILTQSRYILLDMFLLDFGFLALFFYFRYFNGKGIKNLLWMGIFAGLSASIKWTGVAFIGLVGIIELITFFRKINLKHFIRLVIYFGAIPLLIYFSVFVIHFSLLTKSGEGDAFMTPQFRASLIGTEEYKNHSVQPLNIFQKFIELNKEMYSANKTLTATHPYGSKWYTWPLMLRPIYYWDAPAPGSTTINDPPKEQKIYLLGNPLVWWGSTVALIYLILTIIGRNFFKDRVALILLGGYIINFLPFIGISRVMFLYHYFSGLIFAILMFGYCIDKLKRPNKIVWTLLAAALILFIFFAPLSYGLALNNKAFMHRMWLTSWQ